MSRVIEKKAERIPAAERREQILQAAARVFGARGYSGATTDLVAQEAGISQPYVVRMFGGKDNLLVAVLERAISLVQDALRQVIADSPNRDRSELVPAMGLAYVDLIEDDTILMALMQGFLLGHHPQIGPCARRGFTDIYRLLRDEAGFGPQEASDFLAQGMMINTLLALRMPAEHGVDPTAQELVDQCFGHKTPLVLRAVAAQSAREAGTSGGD